MRIARVWAVVPVKGYERPKQRLASVLTLAERRELSRAMLDDLLAALAACPGLAGVIIVSGDRSVGGTARRFGARLLPDPQLAGQSAAVTAAATLLAREGTASMITIPADVPLVSAAEIEKVLAAHGSAPAVTLVPAIGEGGTNAAACSPPDVLPFHFGRDSFKAHRRAARERGIEPAVVHLPGLGLDIDRPDDLCAFLDLGSTTRTHAFLVENGIAGRFAAPPGPDRRPQFRRTAQGGGNDAA